MKKLLKKILIKFFDPIAGRLGYVKKNNKYFTNKNGLLDIFFSNLKRLGFTPKHIVDIGANHGTWTRYTLQYFPDAKYTLLEPQAWMKDSIQDLLIEKSNIEFHAVGAGKAAGKFKFTIVNRDDSCSFIYTEEEARERGYKQIEVPVVVLNEFLSGEAIPDIIKIDAEGLDLEVLEGASDFFGKTEVFMVEAAVVSNKVNNTIDKVIEFMNRHNYQLFEITDLNRPFSLGVLWLTELVFIKKNGIIASEVLQVLDEKL